MQGRRLLVAGLLLLASPLAAQQHVPVPNVPPAAEDIGSIDGIMRAFYATVTGPAGQPRQWGRDRTLYIPDVRFIAIDLGPDGKTRARVMSHQDFVDRSNGAMVKRGFFERELGRTTTSYGNMTQVRSGYEMREKEDGPVIGRGVNVLNLYFDGSRWWIASAMWEDEREGNPVPAELLGTN